MGTDPRAEADTYTDSDLRTLGLQAVGTDVRVHRTALFFGAEHIRLGSHVRIDAYAVLTAGPGEVRIGNYVHLAVGSAIFGTRGGVLEDFTALSGRVCVYSTGEDYTGASLTNPTVPSAYRAYSNLFAGSVHLEKHAIVGAGSVILPGVRLHEGAAVGAVSCVKTSVPAFTIVSGNPATKIADRRRDVLELERRLLAEESAPPAG